MRFALACALLLCAPLNAAAQPYAAKPIRLVVTYPPGGGADTMARLLSPKLGEALGQPIVVENRAGASGTIAADLVAKSSPDGYTLMLDAANYAVNPSLYPKLPYDPAKAFAPVTLLALFPNVVVVTPAFPVSSIRQLIEKIRSEPGKIAFASSGNGSAQHLAAELFRQRAGLDMVHVPYKGGGPALIDVMAGQVPLYFGNMASALPHVKNGKLKALAITGAKRSPAAPDLPTVAESGMPGYQVYEWNAIFAPAGTPEAILRRLHAEIAKALAAPDLKERIAALGGEIVASSPGDTAAWLREQTASWAKVVREGNIKVE
ncbi:MAG TPA: tripartite tricarboxylate transporter substrate binding protein [Burkholderiales bacterium]|nr:tripartite tricarboxylate transporter substrate binding protein [Burkholderiales bacterium]